MIHLENALSVKVNFVQIYKGKFQQKCNIKPLTYLYKIGKL